MSHNYSSVARRKKQAKYDITIDDQISLRLLRDEMRLRKRTKWILGNLEICLGMSLGFG